jgi:hypothetical protein
VAQLDPVEPDFLEADIIAREKLVRSDSLAAACAWLSPAERLAVLVSPSLLAHAAAKVETPARTVASAAH